LRVTRVSEENDTSSRKVAGAETERLRATRTTSRRVPSVCVPEDADRFATPVRNHKDSDGGAAKEPKSRQIPSRPVHDPYALPRTDRIIE
jgi:hypothetical protein